MTRQEALAKVRKLLRLGASSNQHEASRALHQAQVLIQAHAIDDAELDDDGLESIGEEERLLLGFPVYVPVLANHIARVFGLTTMLAMRYRRGMHRRAMVFIGSKSRAEVGRYAFDVLLRQLERDRRHHLKRVKVAKNRAARGDLFGLHWVAEAAGKLQAFAGDSRDPQRLVSYMRRHYPDLGTVTAKLRESKAVGFRDAAAGAAAGRKAQLNRGVSGSRQGQQALPSAGGA